MEPLSFHSVTLDPDKCRGCTTCLRFCPTEAIRVRKGKARIIDERCIDCGTCIRICPYGAKKAVSDPLSSIDRFPVRVALPAPTLYGQFDEKHSIDRILSALLHTGFTGLYEVALAAELVSGAARDILSKAMETGGPRISSACPAVVKLIQVRFPSLLDRLMPVISPMETAARVVKERLFPGRNDVGVFFISPCAAKVTVSRYPQGLGKSCVDGVIGIRDIYVPIANALPHAPERKLGSAGREGIAWAHIDGEIDAVGDPRSISVSGISDVIGVFEELENGKLGNVAFIEALACPAGCVGGPLAVENPYIARARLRAREEKFGDAVADPGSRVEGLDFAWTQAVAARPSLQLHPDMLKALIMMEEMDLLSGNLPGLDCGACGAPSCRSLAEDIVRGDAVITDCVFKLKEEIRKVAEKLLDLERIQAPGLDRD